MIERAGLLGTALLLSEQIHGLTPGTSSIARSRGLFDMAVIKTHKNRQLFL